MRLGHGRNERLQELKMTRCLVLTFLIFAAAVAGRDTFAQTNNVTEAEAKMFAASAGYERFMGRWSRLLSPPIRPVCRHQKR